MQAGIKEATSGLDVDPDLAKQQLDCFLLTPTNKDLDARIHSLIAHLLPLPKDRLLLLQGHNEDRQKALLDAWIGSELKTILDNVDFVQETRQLWQDKDMEALLHDKVLAYMHGDQNKDTVTEPVVESPIQQSVALNEQLPRTDDDNKTAESVIEAGASVNGAKSKDKSVEDDHDVDKVEQSAEKGGSAKRVEGKERVDAVIKDAKTRMDDEILAKSGKARIKKGVKKDAQGTSPGERRRSLVTQATKPSQVLPQKRAASKSDKGEKQGVAKAERTSASNTGKVPNKAPNKAAEFRKGQMVAAIVTVSRDDDDDENNGNDNHEVVYTVQISHYDPKTNLYTCIDPDPDPTDKSAITTWTVPPSKILDYTSCTKTFHSGDAVYALYRDQGQLSTEFYKAIVSKLYKDGRQLRVQYEDGDTAIIQPAHVFLASEFTKRRLLHTESNRQSKPPDLPVKKQRVEYSSSDSDVDVDALTQRGGLEPSSPTSELSEVHVSESESEEDV
ncbi:uncharacterized protein SPPG_01547 [Spizellomyces punctatus DAOM BR117]|uniref:SGF29 C-terminal domain-containing protein n=1 Tax=Spizellomyces punctatus (strain DAOM BR117) TaxID=645134 RepID=A0A0L0HSR3_SPIPD|nr:uncharacterized protein SPPG_01547 [Spizellomyces punctatus DAOM BR117]KND04107.1 hypothetical protein SPPG_01547 [Spizellomyces punctatus DAOM BR117]|eukprot:XP_016612146.1 hypothetical protein SPPG_01547 [Spizellomyces punctatus DAOM BR117]